MQGLRILRNVELANTIGNGVVDARLLVRPAIREVRVKKVTRTTFDGELPRAHFQPGVRGLRALGLHNFRSVPCARIERVAAGKAASMQDKHSQNGDKRKRPDGGTNRDSLRRAGIAASLHVIPYFPGADENKDE